MLIIEKTSNGQSMVVVKKDWHPNRIGRAYQPNKNYVDSYFMEKLQGALLVKRPMFKNK